MFFTKISPHTVSLVLVTTLGITVWSLEKVVIEIEVKRNNTSIQWDNKLTDKKSKEFREMSLVVRTQLRQDLKELQGVREIKVQSFTQNEGGTLCEFECKVNSNATKEDIENVLNMTIDISGVAEIAYTQINMSLNLSNLLWIEAYNDHNTSEYKNMTTAIKAALFEVYKDTDDVVDFEITSVTKAPDGSLIVQYRVLLDPDSNLHKADLQETMSEFTKDGGFEKMITGVKKRPKQEEETGSNDNDEDEKDKAPIGLIVFGAVMMSLLILTFIVVILRQNWKYIKEHSPEARFETYQRKSDRMVNVPVTTAKKVDNATVPTITIDDISVCVVETPDSRL